MSDPLVISNPIAGLSDHVTGQAITLNNPARNNALTSELTSSFLSALDEAVANNAKIVILDAAGANFSTGGDIGRFSQELACQNGDEYARELVGQLQKSVFQLLSMDTIIITAAQGAITGGSAGFIFASDIVVFEKSSFIQPYYREVGFAPDGGWSALLPEIIGAKNAASYQFENKRIEATEAVNLGIGQHLSLDGDAKEKARALAIEFSQLPNIDALITAKRLVWNKERLERIQRGLNAETGAFLALLDTPHMASTLASFNPSRAS